MEERKASESRDSFSPTNPRLVAIRIGFANLFLKVLKLQHAFPLLVESLWNLESVSRFIGIRNDVIKSMAANRYDEFEMVVVVDSTVVLVVV